MKEQKITLENIAGYATERMVWQLVSDLAQLSDPISSAPERIVLHDEHWQVEWGSMAGQSTSWTIGALAFYALMGVMPFEDGKGQTASSPVPRIGTAHCSERLSSAIYRCLSFTSSEQPTTEWLHHEAEEALKVAPTPQRRIASPSGKSYKSPLQYFWPEEMRAMAILLVLVLSSMWLHAQSTADIPDEMTTIVQRCLLLRDGNNNRRVSREFARDNQWTMMDELDIDRKGECTIHDKVNMIGLNDLCYRIAKSQRGITNTGGRFRNGQDPRYRYSFIEVTAKKGASVSYDITGREGMQMFAVISVGENTPFEIHLTTGGEQFMPFHQDGSTKYISVDKAVQRGDLLHLTIINQSGSNQAFIIVNYNSREMRHEAL